MHSAGEETYQETRQVEQGNFATAGQISASFKNTLKKLGVASPVIRRIAIASYSASLASKFNRRVQRIIDSPEYAAFFPETTIKRGARPPEYLRTADEVEIVGPRGGLLSVGREGALTGNRVDCFILDDLYRK